MDVEAVRHYFNEEKTVEHYARATVNLGLWESEEILCRKYFDKSGPTLDLGCGAGRVALALRQRDYLQVIGVDLAEEMAQQAAAVAEFMKISISFEQGDATRLRFDDCSFQSVIFAFNGLMQIPGAKTRLKAVREIFRILKPGGVFIFTTLDRDSPLYRSVFSDPTDPAHDLSQNPHLLDYGDRHFNSDHGTTFMHVPDRGEVVEALEKGGFKLLEDRMRSSLSKETAAIRDFSEDCRFWVAQRPEVGRGD